MNKYLTKIAAILQPPEDIPQIGPVKFKGHGALRAKLGLPASQPIPAQTLQVLSQSADSTVKKQATGAQNVVNKGGPKVNKPARNTSKIPQKMPGLKKGH